MEKIKIDIDKIPKIEMEILASTLIEGMKRFYDDPENEAAFQAWIKTRNGA